MKRLYQGSLRGFFGLVFWAYIFSPTACTTLTVTAFPHCLYLCVSEIFIISPSIIPFSEGIGHAVAYSVTEACKAASNPVLSSPQKASANFPTTVQAPPLQLNSILANRQLKSQHLQGIQRRVSIGDGENFPVIT